MRGSAARAFLPGLVVLALVGVVAVAATGSTSAGSDDARAPGDALLDLILSLFLVALLPGAALLLYGLMQRKDIARELASGRYPRHSFVLFLVFMLVFGAGVYLRMRGWRRVEVGDEGADVGFPGLTPRDVPEGAAETTYEPAFAWLPLLAVVGLAAVAVAALLVSSRRRSAEAEDEDALAEALAEVLDDTLDDLRAEGDPRRAVIAAYARLERVLAAHGLPRRRAETSQELLARVLEDLEVDARSVRRLAELFVRAKFSQHEIDVGMKEEAIEALAHVRDELARSASEDEAALAPVRRYADTGRRA